MRRSTLFLLLGALCWVSASAHAVTLSLRQAVDQAIKNNEGMLQAEQRLLASESELRLAEADQHLQLHLSGDYSQSERDEDKLKDYAYRLELSQLIGRVGAIPDSLDQAQEAYRRERINYDAARQDVAFQVRLVFQNILLTQEEIQERRVLESELLKKLERAEDRKQAGLVIQVYVLSAELELVEQQLELNKLERRLDVDQAELSRLLGLDPMEPVEATGDIPEASFDMDYCVETARGTRTELQDLEDLIRRQERLIHETRWNRIPEFTASYRYKDVGVDLLQRNNTWDLLAKYDPAFLEKDNEQRSLEREGWEVGFQFRVPFLEGSRTELLMDQAVVELQRLQYELQGREKEITIEIHRKFREVSNARERVSVEQKRVEVQAERLRIIETLLESDVEGTQQFQFLTFDDVITVRQEYTNAQRFYYQARRDYAQAQEELRKAMGLTE